MCVTDASSFISCLLFVDCKLSSEQLAAATGGQGEEEKVEPEEVPQETEKAE